MRIFELTSCSVLSCEGDVHPHGLAIWLAQNQTLRVFQEGWVAEIGVGTGILTSALLRRPGCLGVVGFEMDEEILKQGEGADGQGAGKLKAGRPRKLLAPSLSQVLKCFHKIPVSQYIRWRMDNRVVRACCCFGHPTVFPLYRILS